MSDSTSSCRRIASLASEVTSNWALDFFFWSSSRAIVFSIVLISLRTVRSSRRGARTTAAGFSADAGGLAHFCGQLSLAVINFLVDGIQVGVVAAPVVGHLAVANFNNARGDALHEMAIMRGEDDGSLIVDQALSERFDRVDIQVVAGFVERFCSLRYAT